VTNKRIDIHHHIYPPAFTRRHLDRIVADAPTFPAGTYLDWTPQKSLDVLDRHDIARAIVSITSPGIWFGDKAGGQKNARECNDFGARLIADHPNRFGMFAAIPVPDIDASLGEIEHAMDVLKLDGIGIVTSYEGKLIGDPSFAPVFAELDRRKALVFVHPVENGGLRVINPWLVPPILEFPFDTTRAIVSLALSGALARYRNIRFIFSHAGGPLAQMLGRIEASINATYSAEQHASLFPKGLRALLSNLYFDVISMANPSAWATIGQMANNRHLLFGTDFPFIPAAATVHGLESVGLNDTDRARIDHENAADILKARTSATR
jgi:6-methylsalicylate decarboxylase